MQSVLTGRWQRTWGSAFDSSTMPRSPDGGGDSAVARTWLCADRAV